MVRRTFLLTVVFLIILSGVALFWGWENRFYCGGFANIICPRFTICWKEGNYPDAGAICLKPIWEFFVKKDSRAVNKKYPPKTDQIIIKFKDGLIFSNLSESERSKSVEELGKKAGIKLVYVREMSGNSYVLKLPVSMEIQDLQKVIAKLETEDIVEYASPDLILTIN